MCGRFTLANPLPELLSAEFGVPIETIPQLRPRANIAPTDEHIIIREKAEVREALPAHFGLVNTWAKDNKRAGAQINARAERVDTTPAFREAFAKRRCIIPADGFFEWTGTKDERRPLWFTRPDHGLLAFAGIQESWQPRPGEWQRTFAIITTDANSLMRPIHDRMPVLLSGDAIDQWLDPTARDHAALKALLRPAPEDLLVYREVSPLLNSPKNDDVALLEGVEPPGDDRPQQLAML